MRIRCLQVVELELSQIPRNQLGLCLPIFTSVPPSFSANEPRANVHPAQRYKLSVGTIAELEESVAANLVDRGLAEIVSEPSDVRWMTAEETETWRKNYDAVLRGA